LGKHSPGGNEDTDVTASNADCEESAAAAGSSAQEPTGLGHGRKQDSKCASAAASPNIERLATEMHLEMRKRLLLQCVDDMVAAAGGAVTDAADPHADAAGVAPAEAHPQQLSGTGAAADEMMPLPPPPPPPPPVGVHALQSLGNGFVSGALPTLLMRLLVSALIVGKQGCKCP
jgi:hypothetical protein